MNGTSSLISAGVTSETGSIPHVLADTIRRSSSCMPRLGAGDLDAAALVVDVELLVLAHALQRQRGHLLVVVDREDEVRGVAGRAARVGQRALVDQRDVGLAEAGQVVGDAVADDPRADDHDALGGGQPPGFRSSHETVIYQMQVSDVNATRAAWRDSEGCDEVSSPGVYTSSAVGGSSRKTSGQGEVHGHVRVGMSGRRRLGGSSGWSHFGLAAGAAEAASAATLSVNAACYVFATKTPPTMVVTGSGYAPGDLVEITSNVGFAAATATADAGGNIAVSTQAPLPPKVAAGAQPVVLTADDESINGSIPASVPLNVAFLYVFHGGAKKRPGLGAFREKTSWAFSGFAPASTSGVTTSIHGRQVAKVRFGKASGPCGVLKTRAKLFPATPHHRSYPVQVDDSKRYSKHAFPKVSGRLTLTTVF